MDKKNHLKLASDNSARLRSLGRCSQELQLVYLNTGRMAENLETAEQVPPRAVGTLHALLSAEARFLSCIREIAADRCKIKEDIDSVQRDLNHENVFHIARFFFLLKALDCSTPETVGAFIDSHNAKIRSLIDSKSFHLRTKGELEKAFMKRMQKIICMDTIGWLRRPVFARTEIAAFLFDHMGRDAIIRTIDLMVTAGLLIETKDDPLEGSNRKLIRTDGRIEDAVLAYLNDIQRDISNPPKANS